MNCIDRLNSKCLNKNRESFCKWTKDDIIVNKNYYRSYCNKINLEYKLCEVCENIIAKEFASRYENGIEDIIENGIETSTAIIGLNNKIKELELRLERLERF
jgi:hypothetical protein